MKRLHLFEFHDLPWFPSAWRNVLTDFMAFAAVNLGLYRPIVPKLESALKTMQCRKVVDLCSGAGGPAVSILEELGEVDGQPVTITLTDKYPNVLALHRLAARSPDRVSFSETPVDAATVPEELDGFRTLFASFHHFDVDEARAILRDAVSKNEGIGVFEITERKFRFWVPVLVLTPLYLWLITPLIRPFSWQRLLWTYVIPLWLLAALWDGLVSCFRTYTPRELRDLTAGLGADGYTWDIGRIRSAGGFGITYLIGVPGAAGHRRGQEGLRAGGVTEGRPGG